MNETEIGFLQFCNSTSKYTYSKFHEKIEEDEENWIIHYENVKKADKRLEKTKTKLEKNLIGWWAHKDEGELVTGTNEAEKNIYKTLCIVE